MMNWKIKQSLLKMEQLEKDIKLLFCAISFLKNQHFKEKKVFFQFPPLLGIMLDWIMQNGHSWP